MARSFLYPLKVTHVEALRFHVESRGKKTAEVYLVDLQEFDGNGQCGCENFQFRLNPKLDRGDLISADTRCHHIKAARDWFLDRQIETINERKT